MMQQQSDTFRGLENMVWVLIGLERWKTNYEKLRLVVQEMKYGKIANTIHSLNNPQAKADLQAAHDQLATDIQPLLTEWLELPRSDDEKADLETIRTTYLPDMILSYISALYFSGHKLSREILSKIMNLSIDIAAHGSKVGEAFQAAARMADLMDYMAVGSLAVLRAEEVMAKRKGGKGRRVKPGRRGENLDIWNMKLPAR